MPFLAVFVSVLQWAQGLRDPDQYWHVLIGQDILENWRFGGDPSWVFGPSLDGWVTTQWLAEVAMAAGYALFGWQAGLYSVIVFGSALLLWWGWLLLRPGAGLPVRAVVFTGLAFSAVSAIQERPTLVSFALATVLAVGFKRWVLEGWWPKWWQPAALIVVWAQFHGAWVLVPVVMALAAVVEWFESRSVPGSRVRLLRRGVWIGLSSLAGGLTPAGLYGLFAVLTVGSASSEFLAEWQPTTFNSNDGWGLAVVLGVGAIAWARGRDVVPTAEIVSVLALAVFAFTAYRNVLLALILIAPVVAARAALVWPVPWRPTDWTDVFAAGGAAVAAGLTVVLALVDVHGRDPLREQISVETVEALNAAPGERRVFNGYNIAGLLMVATDDHVKVALDGRTDRYGADGIRDHVGVLRLSPGWRDTLETLDPTDVVVEVDSPLWSQLEYEGWTVVVNDDRWVYLTPPADSSS